MSGESTPPEAAVRFEDVSLHFGDTPALDHVSFEIFPGQTIVVFGSAGSGKTVLLKVAVGLMKPDSGRVYLFGEDISRMREDRLFDLRAKVGILFQEGALFDSMTIAENVGYPLENQRALQTVGAPDGSGANQPSLEAGAATAPAGKAAGSRAPKRLQTILDRVTETLRFVELEETLEKFPSELSGGMRRRVGIARAVVTKPELLLYDSPTAGLDPITAHTIIALILKERDIRNTATIMVTHRYQDGQLMANFRYNPKSGEIEPSSKATDPTGSAGTSVSTRFWVMSRGQLVFEGSQSELEANQDPYVRKFLRPGAS